MGRDHHPVAAHNAVARRHRGEGQREARGHGQRAAAARAAHGEQERQHAGPEKDVRAVQRVKADGGSGGEEGPRIAGSQRPGEQPQGERGQERVQRGLEDQHLVKGDHAGEDGEERGEEGRATIAPAPRGVPDEPHGDRPEHDLHRARGEERGTGGGGHRREHVDVQRRDEVRAGAQPQIARPHARGQRHVRFGVEASRRLQQGMISELRQHERLDHEGQGHHQDEVAPARRARGACGGVVAARLPHLACRASRSPMGLLPTADREPPALSFGDRTAGGHA